jgi:drug/metabolite transporter (DMT)-like permease
MSKLFHAIIILIGVFLIAVGFGNDSSDPSGGFIIILLALISYKLSGILDVLTTTKNAAQPTESNETR